MSEFSRRKFLLGSAGAIAAAAVSPAIVAVPERSWLIKGIDLGGVEFNAAGLAVYRGTDNPAWVFYNLLARAQWGEGRSVDESSLIEWVEYSDEMVPA